MGLLALQIRTRSFLLPSEHVAERPRVVRAGLLALQIRVVEPRGADRVRGDDVLRDSGKAWEDGAGAGPTREERVERVDDGVGRSAPGGLSG